MIYCQPAQYESGTTEALLEFPEEIGDLLRAEMKKTESKAIVSLDTLSAVKQGLWVVIAMACRHFRTPFPPQLWMPFLPRTRAADVPGPDEVEDPPCGKPASVAGPDQAQAARRLASRPRQSLPGRPD